MVYFFYVLIVKQTRKEVMNYTRFLLIGIEQQDGRISKNVLVVLLLMTHRSWESYTDSMNEDVWILTRYWELNNTNITYEGNDSSFNFADLVFCWRSMERFEPNEKFSSSFVKLSYFQTWRQYTLCERKWEEN